MTDLRSTVRRIIEHFLDDLAAQGCAAMGYRLSGRATLKQLCVKHLHAAWRAVVTFPQPDVAVVLLVGEHLSDPNRNLYDLLYLIIGHAPAPKSGRNNHRAARMTTDTRPWSRTTLSMT